MPFDRAVKVARGTPCFQRPTRIKQLPLVPLWGTPGVDLNTISNDSSRCSVMLMPRSLVDWKRTSGSRISRILTGLPAVTARDPSSPFAAVSVWSAEIETLIPMSRTIRATAPKPYTIAQTDPLQRLVYAPNVAADIIQTLKLQLFDVAVLLGITPRPVLVTSRHPRAGLIAGVISLWAKTL
ncbi:hypothetical protein M408DRAFT_219572 [Serendipita vermifera MAFF 305830]|uniref:Uncharacterized protein n=1 Tax=Serendipita vermifera MAFF 305830 TaxID=933852 RepID=A0A0C3BLZ4_SERVB|nr:hypothetical protein M408DRAFT_219572 [Serendipita vermifera MAFF 305830]